MQDQSSETRTCRKCGEIKPVPLFARGHQAASCKMCVARYERQRAARHRVPKPPKSRPTEKRCLTCGGVKPISAFHRSQVHKGVEYHAARCMTCTAAERRAKHVHKPSRKLDPATKERRCYRCGEIKPLESFPPSSKMTLGRMYRCRACCNTVANERRRADPARAKAQKQKHYVLNREQILSKSRAYRDTNRNRISALSAIRRAANPEPNRRRAKAWRLANLDRFDAARQLRRARMKGVPSPTFTAKEWAEIQLLFGYRCAYCWERPARLTQDHIQPLSRNGLHNASNIVPACAPCNYRKQKKNLLEFLLYRNRLTAPREC